MSLPRLLLLTDRSQLPPGRTLVDTLAACRSAGLEGVVVREHDLDSASRSALVAALVDLGLWVVSSRIAEPSSHALHLAADQPAPVGATCAWGRSCHSRADVTRAAEQGAGWSTLSPFASTASKPGYGPPLPLRAYADHPVPVLALGGVTPANAARAVDAGAYGVAVMGEVMRAHRPGDVVSALLAALPAPASLPVPVPEEIS